MGRFDDPKPWAPDLERATRVKADARLRYRGKLCREPNRRRGGKWKVITKQAWRRALVAMLLPALSRDIGEALGCTTSRVCESLAELRGLGLLDATGRLKQITPP